MNTPLSWIKEYVPELEATAEEYNNAMTLSGTKVENYQCFDKNLEHIVVGQVVKVERHPDAEKLVICQVDIGTETIQIVTGASNVTEGIQVPVVLEGGKVAGGHKGEALSEEGIKIKKGKLRGVESFGMMCSIEELGSSKEMYPEAPDEGIYIFQQKLENGSDAVEALGLHDTVFEYEITSNRVDCYSVIGIAREAAATFRKPFKLPEVKPTGNQEKVEDYISIEVKDKELCPRYCARVVKNIKIAPSPEWMKRRLAACGIRPINNIVDITNYVMEEYGQPMHAFDLSTIAGNKIIVRRANQGETFQTLDGQERNLDTSILMICDEEKAVGIAGIMGGENSKITDEVKTMLFEAACFNGTNIRLSSKKLGLRTDASGKFEKGLDPANAQAAIDRACQLIEELGAGEVVGGMIDTWEGVKPLRRIPFSSEKINRLLGTAIPEQEMIHYLEILDLSYDKDANEVVIPSFRQDLEGIADIAEEVARLYGYDNIPTTLPTGEATTGKLPFHLRIQELAKEAARFCGFSQGMSYSFESPKVFDKLLLPADSKLRNTVEISNPLGEDFSIMRTISLHGMLTSLSTNYNRRNKNVHLYELGNIYLPKQLPLTELPDERMQFTLGFYGEGDFFSMKGVVEEVFARTGLTEKVIYQAGEKPYLHPNRQADIIYRKEVIGYLGELHPVVQDNYDIGERVYIAVLDMKLLTSFAGFDRKYQGIPKYPSVTRDISMVVPKKVLAGDIEQVIEQKGGQYLEHYELFDIYEGAQIMQGFKSIAYTIVFRAKDKTLEEKEVTEAMNRIIKALKGMGIELRQ